MIGVAVAATGWNYEHRAAQTQKVTEQANKDPLPSDGTSLDSLIRDHNVQPVIYRAPQLTPTPAPVLQKPEVQASPNSQPGTDAAEQARRRAWLTYYANASASRAGPLFCRENGTRRRHRDRKWPGRN